MGLLGDLNMGISTYFNVQERRRSPMSGLAVPSNCLLVPSFFLLMGLKYPLEPYRFMYYFSFFSPISPIKSSQTAIGKNLSAIGNGNFPIGVCQEMNGLSGLKSENHHLTLLLLRSYYSPMREKNDGTETGFDGTAPI